MRWMSAGGVWRVDVVERRGLLRGEIRHHQMLAWQGWLTVLHAHDELNAALAELGAPPLDAMEQR